MVGIRLDYYTDLHSQVDPKEGLILSDRFRVALPNVSCINLKKYDSAPHGFSPLRRVILSFKPTPPKEHIHRKTEGQHNFDKR